MAENLGDLKLTLLLEIKQLVDGSKQVQVHLGKVEKQAKQTATGITSVGTASQKTAGDIFAKVKALGALALGYFAVLRPIKEFLSASVKSFLESKDADEQLLASLKNNTQAFEKLTKQASELQSTTIYSDEQIKNIQRFFALQERTPEMTKKMTDASVQLASVLKVDLDTAMRQVDATMEGNIGRLGRLDADFEKLTKEELANGGAIDLILKKYNGFAQEVGGNIRGQVKIFKNQMDELNESFGEGFVMSFANEFQKLSTNMQTSQNVMKKASLGLGEYVGFIIKGGIPMAMFRKGLDLIMQGAENLVGKFRTSKPAMRDFIISALDMASRLPVVGSKFDFLISKVKEYINKLLGARDAQNKVFKAEFIGEKQVEARKVRATEGTLTTGTSGTGTSKEEEDAFQKRLDQIQLEVELYKLKNGEAGMSLETALIELEKLESQATSLEKQVSLYSEIKKIQDELLANYQAILDRTNITVENLESLAHTIQMLKDVTTPAIKHEGVKLPGGGAGLAIEPDEEAWIEHWTIGVNFAKQIKNILDQRPENLFQAFQMILAIAQQIAILFGLMKVGGLLGGFGGLFGLFGAGAGGAMGLKPSGLGVGGMSYFGSSISGSPMITVILDQKIKPLTGEDMIDVVVTGLPGANLKLKRLRH